MISQAILKETKGTDPQQVTIVEGGATGADFIAHMVAKQNGFNHEQYPADWSLGKKAGLLRNMTMVDKGADVVLAFPLNRARSKLSNKRRSHAFNFYDLV